MTYITPMTPRTPRPTILGQCGTTADMYCALRHEISCSVSLNNLLSACDMATSVPVKHTTLPSSSEKQKTLNWFGSGMCTSYNGTETRSEIGKKGALPYSGVLIALVTGTGYARTTVGTIAPNHLHPTPIYIKIPHQAFSEQTYI